LLEKLLLFLLKIDYRFHIVPAVFECFRRLINSKIAIARNDLVFEERTFLCILPKALEAISLQAKTRDFLSWTFPRIASRVSTVPNDTPAILERSTEQIRPKTKCLLELRLRMSCATNTVAATTPTFSIVPVGKLSA
jgi:hypothetical protein